jgi:hypothetical protein
LGQQDGQPTTGADLAKQEKQRQVQQAFALGWHMAELYHFERVGTDEGSVAWGRKRSVKPPHDAAGAAIPADDAKSPRASIEKKTQALLEDALPGLGSLKPEERRALLVRQVKHDLEAVWTQPDPPPAAELKQLVDTAAAGNPSDFGAAIEALHKVLLEGMTVFDFRIGKSYGLGRALAETTIIPCAVVSNKGVEGLSTDGEKGTALKTALLGMFEGYRVFTIQGWLLDLRDWFDAHAADAVSTTLGGWAFWMFRPTMDGPHIKFDWDDRRTRLRIEAALRRQGDMWRGLLTGEKNPMDIAGPNYYFAAMASVVRKVAGLAWSFLGTGIGLLLFLLLIVAGSALYISSTAHNTTGILSAVIALLTTLGVTTGSAGAAVQKAWGTAEGPLWEAEVSAAIANAAWQNPAPMGSVEAIQLLLAVGEKANARTETLARHPNLVVVRNIPVGRIGIILAVVTTAISVFEADANHLNRDASFFLPPLFLVAFLVLIDGWDILIGLATKQTAPYLALPERIELPEWIMPVVQVLAPVFLVAGLVAGHFFWH